MHIKKTTYMKLIDLEMEYHKHSHWYPIPANMKPDIEMTYQELIFLLQELIDHWEQYSSNTHGLYQLSVYDSVIGRVVPKMDHPRIFEYAIRYDMKRYQYSFMGHDIKIIR